MDKFSKFMEDRKKFSWETFGPPSERDCTYPLLKLQDEVKELLENPDDPMEWADCFLLLIDAAQRKGHSMDDILEFCIQKLEINKKRTWQKQSNGVYRHVKE